MREARSTSAGRAFIGIFLGFSLVFFGSGSTQAADKYPNRPIKLLIPSSPGGPPDIGGRLFAEYLGNRLGQSVVVENRPGALEQVALTAVSLSEPDGYTLVFASSSIMLIGVMSVSFASNFAKDFTPISIVCALDTFAVVRADSPYRSLDDIVVALRASPGKLNAATTVAWSTFQAEMFRSKTATKFEIIRYPGNAQGVQALLAGDVDFRLSVGHNVKPLVEAGKLRFLAANAFARSKWEPSIPTVGESAMPELRELGKSHFYNDVWYGVLAPTNTPRETVRVLHTAIEGVKNDPSFRKRLNDAGLFAAEAITPENFRALLVEETAIAARIAKDAGIKPE